MLSRSFQGTSASIRLAKSMELRTRTRLRLARNLYKSGIVMPGKCKSRTRQRLLDSLLNIEHIEDQPRIIGRTSGWCLAVSAKAKLHINRLSFLWYFPRYRKFAYYTTRVYTRRSVLTFLLLNRADDSFSLLAKVYKQRKIKCPKWIVNLVFNIWNKFLFLKPF